MTRGARLIRFFAGLVLVTAVLAASFTLLIPWVETNGATTAELQASYPGDELIAEPVIRWTHGRTIDAPVEQVWPWVAQMGDQRGGFYSYTWIENAVTGSAMYHNAPAILPEFQDPQPGTVMISDILDLKVVQPGEYMLAALMENSLFGEVVPGLGWTWMWQVLPLSADQTRLVVRMDISSPPDVPAGIMTYVMDLGGWVMERNMLQGIEDRAEGYIEPVWVEYAEIPIWLAALVTGIWAAVLFMQKRNWLPPLLAGLASIAALMLFTFEQPAVWTRLIVVLALIALLAWARQSGQAQSAE